MASLPGAALFQASSAPASLADWIARNITLLSSTASPANSLSVLSVGSHASADGAYLASLCQGFTSLRWSLLMPIDGGTGTQDALSQVAAAHGASVSIDAIMRRPGDEPPHHAYDLVLHGPHYFDDRSLAEARSLLGQALRWARPSRLVLFCCPQSEAPGLLTIRRIANRRMPPGALSEARATCSGEELQAMFASKKVDFQCASIEAGLDLSECADKSSAAGLELFAACLGRAPHELAQVPGAVLGQLVDAVLEVSCADGGGGGEGKSAAAAASSSSSSSGGPAAGGCFARMQLSVFALPAPQVAGPATPAAAAAAASSSGAYKTATDGSGMEYERAFANAEERGAAWFPDGKFRNWGLQNWHRQRAAWKAHAPFLPSSTNSSA